MASIYREGTGWSARVRMNGQEAFKGGFALQKAAKDWARDREKEFTKKKIPKGLGRDTPLAFALRDYVYECVATQKGCKAFVSRVNVYLESAGLALLHAEENPREPGKDIPLTFKITERPVSERRLPRTFDVYRTARLEKRPRTAAQRKALATMRVGDIAAHDIEALKKAMMDDQFSNSSINNELSILSPFLPMLTTSGTGRRCPTHVPPLRTGKSTTSATVFCRRASKWRSPTRWLRVTTGTSHRSSGSPSKLRCERVSC